MYEEIYELYCVGITAYERDGTSKVTVMRRIYFEIANGWWDEVRN